MTQKKKLSNRLLALIISISAVAVILSAILMMNIFIPLKYLSAYINFCTDKPQSGEMRISFIDVGYGDCTLIELPDGKVALIDGGNGSYASQIKILKTLNSPKIDKIDYLFCTSSVTKRCGGLAEIVRYKGADKIYAPIYKNTEVTQAYRNFRHEVENKNQDINECAYGPVFSSEEYGYYFNILYPYQKFSESEHDEVYSPAILISYGGVSVLLMGDLTTSDLLDMISYYKISKFEMQGHYINFEHCNVVKVANCGNKSGKCAQFYDLIQAETAIISTAGEPDLAVLSDVGNFAGDNIYRTDKNGTVTLSITNGSYTVKKERE